MFDPVFLYDETGKLSLRDTKAARAVKNSNMKLEIPDTYDQDKAAARRKVREAGGNVEEAKNWTGFLHMTFGSFRGQTYRWMLENTPGYYGWLANRMISEQKAGKQFTNAEILYRGSFIQYIKFFSEGLEILKRKEEGATPTLSRNMPANQADNMKDSDDDELCAFMDEYEKNDAQQGQTLSDQPSTSQSVTPQDEEFPILKKWKATLPKLDQEWISKTFFFYGTRGSQFDFNRVTKLWYDPPQPSLSRGVLNKQECFFGHRLFIWMPRHLFQYEFVCVHIGCSGKLANFGVHQKTRMVLDIQDYYIIIGEVYKCNECKRTVLSWNQHILSQLDLSERSKFPCILTERYACDLKIVRQMRQRTLGNSSSLVCKQLTENHGEAYLDKCRQYASSYLTFKKSARRGLVTIPDFVEPPQMRDIPRHRWFMKVYQIDVISRLDYELAELTSITGEYLKIDSTKKITNKLAGPSRGTAMWATNVGNEHGQVLMSVLTEAEGEGIRAMINGIIARYNDSGTPPPKVLYTDRDCCGSQCVGGYFGAWPFLNLRLDSWHFMRRFPNGCTTDKHQLYGPFMAGLSHSIFKIDENDYALLFRAKKSELELRGVLEPSDTVVTKHITQEEISRHCKRVTRGTKETTRLIKELIDSLDGDKGLDTCGVPLINSIKMADIWAKQSVHVACLQDPVGVQLYMQVRQIKKGNIDLPVYKCARGSSSLECFHLHMARFIPGTLAKDTNFQVYLLDGIFRWNADRAAEALANSPNVSGVVPLTYNGALKNQTNMLWQELCGRPYFDSFKTPAKYTGELVGLQYLYNQTGKTLPDMEQTIQELENDSDDEGYDDAEEDIGMAQSPIPIPPTVEEEERPPILHIPSDEEYRAIAMEGIHTTSSPPIEEMMVPNNDEPDNTLADEEKNEAVCSKGIAGYDRVQSLAAYLVELRSESTLKNYQAKKLIKLWDNLHPVDQKRTKFSPRFKKKSWSGKFGGRGKTVAPGVESITKALLGPNQSPAQWPNCNRYTEATVEKLLRVFPGNVRRDGKTHTRWSLILDAFHRVRKMVTQNPIVMTRTEIMLPMINKKTLTQWYNNQEKKEEQTTLLQGLDLPKPASTASNVPPARKKPAVLPSTVLPPQRFVFTDPVSTAGLANIKTRKRLIEEKPKDNLRFILPRPDVVSVLPINPPLLKTKRTYKKPTIVKCAQCGLNRKNSTSHKTYYFQVWCQNSCTESFETWKAARQQERQLKKQSKK